MLLRTGSRDTNQEGLKAERRGISLALASPLSSGLTWTNHVFLSSLVFGQFLVYCTQGIYEGANTSLHVQGL